MKKLKELLLLDKSAENGLRKASVAIFFTSLSLMIPFTVTMQLFTELLKPLSGGIVSWHRIGLLFFLGTAALILIFLLSKNDYTKTYVSSYRESQANRLRVAEHMRKLPMSFFNEKDLSELSSTLMSDCTNIETATSNIVPQLLANIASASVVCLLLATFDWRMASAVFLMLPASILVFWGSRTLQRRLFAKHISAKLEAEKQSQEYLDGIKVVRACNLGGENYKKLDDAFMNLRRAAIQVELGAGTIMAISAMLLRGGVGIVAFVGIRLLTAGEIDVLVFLMFLLISGRIYEPILTILTLLPDMLYLSVSSKRLLHLMQKTPMTGTTEFTPAHTDIVFDGVRFSYGRDSVLNGVSFTAKTGEITALVGPSGSGKSTVSKLAARFWDADEGIITVGASTSRPWIPKFSCSTFPSSFKTYSSSTTRLKTISASEDRTPTKRKFVPRQEPPAVKNSSKNCRKATALCSAKTVPPSPAESDSESPSPAPC